MKAIRLNKSIPDYLNSVKQCYYSTQVNPAYPYTSELYKKNYIKYPVQSRSAICHDYVYHGNERLPSLEERLKDYKDPSKELINDIGKSSYFLKLTELKNEINQKIKQNKLDKTLEKEAKDLKLEVPIDEIENQTKLFKYFKDVVQVANHYNINQDLFEKSFFRPSLDLNVQYADTNSNVYVGNKIEANKTVGKPIVSWADVLQSNKDSNAFHSLAFINLDGNFQNNDEEMLLWFVGNVQNNDINSGQELMEYIQPFPMRGTGFHRCAFVLYEHKSKIEFDLNQKTSDSSFQKRCFSAKKFFNKHASSLTPVGLSFFQTQWDLSVRDVFHNNLMMKEPVYEFDHGPRFIPKFEKFPRGQAFNWYLQEYHDRKDINEYVMKDYLKAVSPFEADLAPAKYPILDVKTIKPRWLKYEIENRRQRKQEWNLVPFEYSHEMKKKRNLIENLPYQ